MSTRSIKRAIILSSLLLGLGLFGPCMSIYPNYGGFTMLVQLFRPDSVSPITFSIARSIVLLFEEHQIFVALVILVFSVLFPIWKLGVLWDSCRKIEAGHPLQAELHWVDLLGKYSMVDIFVLALIVVAIKGLPGGTEIGIRWGMYAFFVSVIVSMFIPKLLHRLEKESHE